MRKAAGALKPSALQRTEARARLHSSPDKALVSLSDAAYEAIKQRILSLALRPGLFVNEQTLSDMVGISRMPVHQAVQRLKADGLLDVIARKGIVIRMTSFKELLELFEARLIVEPGIAALAAQRINTKDIKALRKMLAQSREHLDQNRSRRNFMALDRAFHAAIAEAAGNPILAEAQRPLHERSTRVWLVRVWGPDGLKDTQREHEDILTAIAASRPEAARKAMAHHLEGLRDRIVQGSRQFEELVPEL
jgi:GntR family transcriptional regulator, rspAB operon transcriptional repressor